MTEDDIHAMIGLLVIETQTVETLLDLILTYVLQDGTPLTYDRIIHLEKQHRRKPLGVFFKAMRERADYSEDLSVVFDRFLENRNRLIHRFKEVDGHVLSSEEDIAKVHAFLVQLSHDTWALLKFFAAWIVAWQQQTGIGKGSLEKIIPAEGTFLVREINDMANLVKDQVFLKE